MLSKTDTAANTSRVQKRFAQLAMLVTLILGYSLLLMAPVWADSPGLAPPPDMRLMDQNDIDLASHTPHVPGPRISVGVPGQGGLTWAPYFDGGNWTVPDWQVSLQYDNSFPSGTRYAVTLFGQPESFTKSGSAFAPTYNTGGTLTYDSGSSTYTYVRRDGTIVVFNAASFACGLWCTPALASTITYPSGETLTLTYRSYTYWYGLSSVRSNLGYQLKINYECSAPNTDPCFTEISSVIAINNAFDYCDPSGNSCPSLAHPWSTLSYSYSYSGTCPNCSRTESIMDATGHQWQGITSSSLSGGYYDASNKVVMPSGRTWELKTHYPEYTVPNQWTFDDGTDPAHPWTYLASTDDYGDNVVDVTDPLGHVREVVSDPGTGFPISDTADHGGLNLTKTYENDGAHITQVIQPEGNYTQWTYDPRGNVTQITQVAKPGSGMANIIQAAHFPASCDSIIAPSSNFRTCNKPDYVTDAGYGAAGNNLTYYTYHADSGEVATATSPAVSNGQPITTSTYTQVHAWYKNGTSGAYVDGGPVWKSSTVSKCLADASLWGSFNWGAGSWAATGTCTSPSQQNLTTYAYPTGNSSSATNALASSVTAGSGDGSLAATTATTYDIYSNVATITNPLNATTAYFYDMARNQTGVIGPDPDGSGPLKNPAIRTIYDVDGRVSEVDQGTTTSQSSMATFASLQQDTTTYVPGFIAQKARIDHSIGGIGNSVSVTQYSYDLAYNLTCTAMREDASQFGSLPASACTQSGGTAYDQITYNTYDAANRLTTVQSGYGASPITVVTNTYSSNSQVATVTDGNGNKSQYTYDGDGRVIQLNFPSKTTPGTVSTTDYEQYSYAANGNRLTTRLRSGETATSSYDALGRLIQKTFSTVAMPSVYYGYDLLGDLLYASYGSPGGYGVSFTYDALQRKTSETSTGVGYSRTMSSGYDLAGNRTRLTWPDGNYIQYTYDALNRMKQVQQNGATVLAKYSYDDLGREVGITRGNGAATAMTYSGTSQDWSLAQGGAMSPAVTFAMTYTPAGQVSQRTISNTNYQYGVTASGTNYCPNGLNQYATVGGTAPGCSGGTGYSYDGRGNLTSDGARSFTYNLANQLTDATTGSGSTAITYDPLGRLAQVTASSTTQYLYDGAMLVAEYNTSGTVLRRYVPGAGVDEALVWYEGADLSSPHWLHTDQQGSVIATSDASATAVPYAYSATGEPKGGWSSAAPAFRYTGQVAIASAALYFYKARMYDPALGRFLQTDPTGYQAGMNLYAYVANNYTNATDPSGRCQWGSITFPDGSTVSFPPAGSDCDDGAFQDAISRLKDQSDNALKPTLPSQPEQATVTATRGTNNQPQQPSCISPNAGPVYFAGGGFDLVIGAGAGISASKFWIPSIGANGVVVTGSGLGGFGAFLGVSGGRVNTFGNFTGGSWRLAAETPVPGVGGEAIFGNQGQSAGAAASGGVGGGLYGGRTFTSVKSSNLPVCPVPHH